MEYMLSRQHEGSFLNKIKSETKIFANINYILDKIENDGYFETIQTTFHQIFSKEMAFAVQGKFNENLRKSSQKT